MAKCTTKTTAMTDAKWKEALTKRSKSLKEFNVVTNNLVMDCINSFNSSVKAAGDNGNKTRFIEFLHPKYNSQGDLVNIVRWLQETTNIKHISKDVKEKKLNITFEGDKGAISKPSKTFPDWLKSIKTANKIEYNEESLLRALKSHLKKCNDNKIDFDAVLKKARAA